jgi:hypothetical protein
MKDGIALSDKADCRKSTVAKPHARATDKPSTSVVVGSSIIYVIMLTIIVIIAKAIN